LLHSAVPSQYSTCNDCIDCVQDPSTCTFLGYLVTRSNYTSKLVKMKLAWALKTPDPGACQRIVNFPNLLMRKVMWRPCTPTVQSRYELLSSKSVSRNIL
jgi:hypothetical protein